MSEESSKGPLVSIIIPTYNRAHIIGRALKSLLDQTYQDFEIIVVDDCSTDNTREVIEEYSKIDNRVRYIRNNKNLGPAGARNVGIHLAKGEFIAFQDDDDEWYPDKLEKQVNLLQSLPENFGVVYSGFYKIVGSEKIYIPSRSIYPREGNILNSLVRGNFVGTPSILVRKSALLDIGLFDENLPILEDWELVIRLSKKYQFKLIDEPLFISYDSPNSVNKQSGAKYVSAVIYIIEKHIDVFSKDKEALSNAYFNCGKSYMLNGERKLGLKYLFLTLRTNPFNPKFWITFIISLFGTDFLKKIMYLKKKFLVRHIRE